MAEVFLADPAVPGGGACYMVDPTGMADPAQTAKIGVGRDAADVSFMTVFTYTMFGPHEVSVTPVGQAKHCHWERSQFVLGCV